MATRERTDRAAPGGGEAPAVVRALALIEHLRGRADGATLAELSRAVRVAPSSLLAILRPLARCGYVERESVGGRYRLGPALAARAPNQQLALAVERLVDALRLLGRAVGQPGADVELATAALRGLGLAAREFGSAVLSTGEAVAGGADVAAEQASAGGYGATGAARPGSERPEASPAVAGPLSPEELDEFLAGRAPATLACVKPDGYPYSVPVWYQWQGGRFWVVPRTRAEWERYLLLNPRVSLAIGEAEPPFRRVVVEGQAKSIEGPSVEARARQLLAAMARRYLPGHAQVPGIVDPAAQREAANAPAPSGGAASAQGGPDAAGNAAMTGSRRAPVTPAGPGAPVPLDSPAPAATPPALLTGSGIYLHRVFAIAPEKITTWRGLVHHPRYAAPAAGAAEPPGDAPAASGPHGPAADARPTHAGEGGQPGTGVA